METQILLCEFVGTNTKNGGLMFLKGKTKTKMQTVPYAILYKATIAYLAKQSNNIAQYLPNFVTFYMKGTQYSMPHEVCEILTWYECQNLPR